MKLCLPLLACALFLQDPKVELRWNWQKGQELVYKSIKKSVTELGAAPLIQEEGNRLSFSVTDVGESGEAAITMKYLAVSVRGSGPLGDYSYDSDKDKKAPEEGPAALAARLVGLSFSLKMLPNGAVTDVQGLDKLLDELLKDAGDDARAARSQLKPMFSAAGFKATMQQLLPPLSGAKVGPQSSWTNTFPVRAPMIGSMKFAQKFTVAGIKGQTALIDEDIRVSIDVNEGFELRDGEGKASAVFSIEQGCYLSRKSAVQMTLVATAGGEMVPIKTVSELTLVSRK
jgi:hypothetical protein